jgi:hypothetical protein
MMPTTFYEVRSRDGVLMAVHKRVDRPDGGKDISWLGPHGAVGLDGTPATALPLFGIDRLDAWPAMSPIVVTEGEKAALALQELGIPTVATVTGAASVPGVEVLRDLEGRAVVLWADHDDAGRKHMQQLADRLEPIAAVGWVVWPDAPAKGDAADFVAGGRTADDVRALLRRATTVPMAVAVSAWPEPASLTTRPDPPVFPVQHFPDWIASFVAALAEATQTPIDMAAMFALAGLATVCCGRVRVEPVSGWVEGLNLFIVVAMEPGSRKSQVHRAILEPIVAYERLLVETAAPDIAEQDTIRKVAEAAHGRLVKAAAAAKKPEERLALEAEARTAAAALERLEVPTPPRLFTADVTPEKLASMLHDNGGHMAVLSAEGGIFDLMAGRYSSGIPNLDVYLSGHAGDPIRVDRRGRSPEYVDRPALTMGLAVQPYVLARIGRKDDFTGRGLLDRFLYARPSGNVGYRRVRVTPVERAIRQRYDTSLRALAAACDRLAETATLVLSPEAVERFDDWRVAIEPRRRPDADLGHVQGWSSKLDGAVVRIAGLLHLADTFTSDWDVPIGDATMAGALEIGDYLIEHALAAFDEIGRDSVDLDARRVLRWLGERSTFTKRECFNSHRSRFQRATDLDAVLELLQERGFIRPAARETRSGRPSERYEVNPAAQKAHNGAEPVATA